MREPDPAPCGTPEDLIAAVLDLAGATARGLDAAALLRQLAVHSVRLKGVQASGVLLPVGAGRPVSLVASGRAARRPEQTGIDLRQGPWHDALLAALLTGRPVAGLSLTHPHSRVRRPRFTPGAPALGHTAATALPLTHLTTPFGALNLFHAYGALGLRRCGPDRYWRTPPPSVRPTTAPRTNCVPSPSSWRPRSPAAS